MRPFPHSLTVLLFVTLVPVDAQPAPAPPCPRPAQPLSLFPNTAFVDGGEVSRGPNGRFVTDAGFAFDMESVLLEPSLGERTDAGCFELSTTLDAEVIDPFTGRFSIVTLTVVP